jgi:hypothetical protein
MSLLNKSKEVVSYSSEFEYQGFKHCNLSLKAQWNGIAASFLTIFVEVLHYSKWTFFSLDDLGCELQGHNRNIPKLLIPQDQ